MEAAISRSGASEKLAAKAWMNVIGAVRRTKVPPWNIPPKEMKALRDLVTDDDILVLPGDNGKATVVMDKQDYDAKMLRMLSDKNTNHLMEKYSTPLLERKMNVLLLELKSSGLFPEGVYAQLRSLAAKVPQLYGLPNVHKQDVPLRPIISFISSPTYIPAVQVFGWLACHCWTNQFSVQNLKSFVDFIYTQVLAEDEIPVSFDECPYSLASQQA